MTKVILSEPKELLERRLGRLLDDCRAAGYSPMLEIGKPAARRQAIVVNAVYMRPLDGSDLSLCSCCAEPYDPVIKSRIAGNYIPINWCPVCRERLREGEARQAVYDDNAKRRRGKAKQIARDAQALLVRLLKALPKWMHETLEGDGR